MDLDTLIKDLTAIRDNNPAEGSLPVKMRTGNGQLITIDEAAVQGDTFGAWIELS